MNETWTGVQPRSWSFSKNRTPEVFYSAQLFAIFPTVQFFFFIISITSASFFFLLKLIRQTNKKNQTTRRTTTTTTKKQLSGCPESPKSITQNDKLQSVDTKHLLSISTTRHVTSRPCELVTIEMIKISTMQLNFWEFNSTVV